MSVYSKKLFLRSILALCLITVFGGAGRAQQFPIKTFTSADGLASSALINIFRDHLGFLWFSTRDGLSRFDGREFTNFQFGNADTLPTVFSFHETRRGDFWLTTGDGLYRIAHQDSTEVKPELATKTNSRRVLLNAEKISEISFTGFYEDSAGTIWVGGSDGLFTLTENNGAFSFKKIEIGTAENVKAITEARDGSLWVGCNTGVFRRFPTGKILFYPIARTSGYDEIFKITEDSDGRVWIAHTRGIFIVQPETAQAIAPPANPETRELTVKEQTVSADFVLPQISSGTILRLAFSENPASRREELIHDIFAASDSKIWFSAQGFLYSSLEGRVRRSGDSAILPLYIQNFAEDLAGNLWIGTNSGALHLARQGFATFSRNEGLGDARILSLYQNSADELFVIDGRLFVNRFEKGKFDSKPINLPDSAKLIYASTGVLLDEHDVWALTENGLYRFDAGDLQAPVKIYRRADGLKGDSLFCGFRDSKGNLWFSTRKTGDFDGLSRFDKRTQKFHSFSTAEGFPNGKSPSSFAEDQSGNLWFGFYDGGLARYSDGRFTDFSSAENLPSGGIFGLLVDKKNRLWMASSGGGVAVVEDLQAEKLHWRRITTEQGLATDNARCLTEDSAGNIYVGTVRGIDRITPETGQIRHFSTSDGLSGDFVSVAFRDKSGMLWFGTSNGLSKIEPQADFAQSAPEIFIDGLQIAGVRYAVSGFGQKEIAGISVGAAENNLEINFLSVGAAENARFQYKLEDSENEQEWSAATEKNSINLARLAPGTYKFSVRAVNSASLTSKIPAFISFKIAPPFWQSGWFRLLVIVLFVGVILIIERTRAARLRELKKAFGKLSVSENRFRQMNDQSPLGIIVFAPDGSIRAVNRAYENFWGITFEQIKHWDFLADEQLIRIGVVEKLRRVFAGETVHFPPEPYDPRENSHGVEFIEKAALPWFESFAYPVKTDAGELLEVILVMEDVTDTKRADEIEQIARHERLRELEQVRRRIAADLHDDIGSSLTQISIWSEVLQRNVGKQSGKSVSEPLTLIGNSSRELVDAMSDIVWAINPQKDFLSELSGKMRFFASDVFSARNINFTFDAPHLAEEFALGANLRREIYLIFKETVNNIVKHSNCKKVEINLSIENSEIFLNLHDDGAGFDVSRNDSGGHGLASMKARAEGLGGKLEIVSDAQIGGTTVTLCAPLGLKAENRA
ncbi:MAG TPA: PAS domain-containing protein [Pyrinomonadaceae bacterium]